MATDPKRFWHRLNTFCGRPRFEFANYDHRISWRRSNADGTAFGDFVLNQDQSLTMDISEQVHDNRLATRRVMVTLTADQVEGLRTLLSKRN